MSTITIPAREVKPGDVIDFGGHPVTLTQIDGGTDSTVIVSVSDLWRADFESVLTIAADLPLNVQRPDPDAELIEVMAKAWWEADGSSWRNPDPTTQVRVRDYARAALAAAREAGLL